jgi:hypothetical protein
MEHHEKERARSIAWHANRRGVLVPPERCEKCGTAASVLVMHHEDYTKPLDVIWLCNPCHYPMHPGSSAAGQSANEKDRARPGQDAALW